MKADDIGGGDGRPPGCKPKVAVSVYRYFPYGGLQKDMLNTVQALVKRGMDVTIFCMSWESNEIPEGVQVRRLRFRGLTHARKARKFDLALARVLKKRNFDLHLSFNKVSGADCYFVDDLPFARGKISWWKRLFSSRYRIYSQMERQVFGKNSSSAEIFCLTPEQKKRYQSIYSTSEQRFTILPPGIDERFRNGAASRELRREAMRKELKLKDDDVALMMIGSAFYGKGVDRAIAAMNALPSEILKHCKLFVVGRNDHERLDKFARRCGVDDRVFFLDARNDIPELLSAADLLVNPARSDAAGIVLLEALCCGTPVLCTGNCGYAKVVGDAGGVVLSHPFRQTKFNRALKLLLSMPGQLDELQQSAAVWQVSEEFFSRYEVMADIIEKKVNDARCIEKSV